MQFPYTRSGLTRWYDADLLADIIKEIGKSYDYAEEKNARLTACLDKLGLAFSGSHIYAKDYQRFLEAVPRLKPE